MADATSTTQGYGQQDPSASTHPYNSLQFQIDQALAGVRTIVLVKVVKTSGTGAVAASGTVDVQPVVNQLDGQNNSTPHGVISNIPIVRMGGGTTAIIADPVVGDIGVMLVSDRDISAVKNTKDIANPGSLRKHSMSDGVYLGSVLSKVPVQTIQFSKDVLNIIFSDTAKISISAGSLTLTLGASSLTLDGSTAKVVAAGGLFVNGLKMNVP